MTDHAIARLATALVLGLALPGPAAASEGEVSSALLVYSDDDHVTVVSPRVGGRAELDELTLDARYAIDAVSAASVDLVTAASPGGFSEVRHQASGSAEHALGAGARVRGGYGASIEPDFVGHGLDVAYQRDVLDRLATVSASYALRYSTVLRAHDPDFSRTRTGHEVGLGWAHVLGPASVLDLGAGLDHGRGFLSNPYRLVRLYAPGQAASATAVVEAVPGTRTGGWLDARLRVRAGPVVTRAEYRLSRDTWGVGAHTLEARGTLALAGETLLLTLQARGYLQGRADFYRGRYDTFPEQPRYRTADKELGRMWTVLAGLDVEWSPAVRLGRALRLGLGFDLYHLRYPEHPSLRSRTASVVTADATLEL